MQPIFAIGLPHGGEWIIVFLGVLILVVVPVGAFGVLLWAILRKK